MQLDENLQQRMRELGIDIDRSRAILEARNRGEYDDVSPVEPDGIPDVDGETVIDRTQTTSITIPTTDAQTRLRECAPELADLKLGRQTGDTTEYTENDLSTLGVLLTPRVAYGVLNGGSATSYADEKKNGSANEQLLDLFRDEFDRLAPEVRGKPKGVTPAVVNPDGSNGPSFLELTFRMLLLKRREARRVADEFGVVVPDELDGGLPFFEMTSGATADDLSNAYQAWRGSDLFAGLDYPSLVETIESAQQPLLAAMTHSSEGRPFGFFTNAWGREQEPLGLPGGHGQNFDVLAAIYRRLHESGKRFVYISNVDNLGSTIDPVSLAILALTGRPAGFDFAFRTPVDVKGGILVYDRSGGMTCADIGVGIDRETVDRTEQQGTPILFNCATGLFSLDWLVPSLDRIIRELPMRISDQDKDAGRYSQAEQVTWEIISMIENPTVFGINKYERFLAAKMIIETFMSSGIKRERAAAIEASAGKLADGMDALLRGQYGMTIRDGRWVPADI